MDQYNNEKPKPTYYTLILQRIRPRLREGVWSTAYNEKFKDFRFRPCTGFKTNLLFTEWAHCVGGKKRIFSIVIAARTNAVCPQNTALNPNNYNIIRLFLPVHMRIGNNKIIHRQFK